METEKEERNTRCHIEIAKIGVDMNEIVYLNYWSKIRTDKDLEKEKKYNNGRIATKILLSDEVWSSDKYIAKRNAFNSKVYTMGWEYNQLIRKGDPLYKEFQIPKRSGGYRTIEAPTDELKAIQKKLVEQIYKLGWIPSNNAHGFTKNRNCKSSLEVHQKHKSRWFLKLDIHDFFGSTTEDMIRKALNINYPFTAMAEVYKTELIKICTKDGIVPQGAPTSPIICNLVMNKYDYQIQKYCHKMGLIYTRYADDILISSEVDFDWESVVTVIKKILDPYTLSENKIRYGSFNGRNWNLGIMFNNKYELTVGHERKHKLKCAVHNYCTKPEIRTEAGYYKLQGELAYCKYIEPKYEWFGWAQIELAQYKPNPPQPATNTVHDTESDELPFTI